MLEMPSRNRNRTNKPFDSLTVKIEYKWPHDSYEWKLDRKILARVRQIGAEGPLFGPDLIGREPCSSINKAILRVKNMLSSVTREIVFEFGEGIPIENKVLET